MLCVKSELHLNQDGVRTGDGTATLPVAELFRQIIGEAKPKLVITVGTCGATFPSHGLGDVADHPGRQVPAVGGVRQRAVRRRRLPRRDFTIPRRRLTAARRMMATFADRT